MRHLFFIVGSPQRPDCQQMYNLFHASDPSAFRIEPLLNYVFRQIPPIKVSRYSKFPMGDGESIQIGKYMCVSTVRWKTALEAFFVKSMVTGIQVQ